MYLAVVDRHQKQRKPGDSMTKLMLDLIALFVLLLKGEADRDAFDDKLNEYFLAKAEADGATAGHTETLEVPAAPTPANLTADGMDAPVEATDAPEAEAAEAEVPVVLDEAPAEVAAEEAPVAEAAEAEAPAVLDEAPEPEATEATVVA